MRWIWLFIKCYLHSNLKWKSSTGWTFTTAVSLHMNTVWSNKLGIPVFFFFFFFFFFVGGAVFILLQEGKKLCMGIKKRFFWKSYHWIWKLSKSSFQDERKCSLRHCHKCPYCIEIKNRSAFSNTNSSYACILPVSMHKFKLLHKKLCRTLLTAMF